MSETTAANDQPADTRARILSAALLVFAERGFDGATIKEITQMADANIAAVNYHFRSKDELVRQVLEMFLRPINEARLAARDKSPRLGPLLPGALHIAPFYWHCRHRGATAQDAQASATRSLEELHTVLRNERDIAALIAEPIRNGPYIPAPDYWKEVRALCDEFSTLLIFDDIPTGLGKTGRLFNMEHFGIAPDITLLGKALGGAVAPLAAVIASARLDGTADMNLGYYTHEKNALSAAAGLATFRVIVDEQLAERAARLEPLVKARLDTLVAGTSVVANVRSIGLMFAVDLGEPDDEGAGMAQRLYYDLLKRGILPMPPKVNTLSFSAPLMIDENDLTGSLDILHSAVQML